MLNKKYLMIWVATLAFAAVSGCGGTPYRGEDQQTGGPFMAPGDFGDSGPNDDSLVEAGEDTPFGRDFTVTGSGSWKSPNIDTDSLLKVTVRASTPGNVLNSGWTGAYACLSLRVSVLNGWTGAVIGSASDVMVANPNLGGLPLSGYCTGAKAARTIDFSRLLPQGHEWPVKIKVSNVMYDNCRTTWGPNYAGCLLTALYQTHQASGSISAVVNQEE